MTKTATETKTTFRIYPIGYIRRSGKGIHLEILEPFRPALKQHR